MKNIRAIIIFLICMCILSGTVSLVSMFRAYKITEKYSDLKTSTSELKAGVQKQIKEIKSKLTEAEATEYREAGTEAQTETQTEQVEDAAAVTFNSETPDEPEIKYTMKLENGSIGIFDSDGMLIRSLNVSVEMLSDNDRILLENGISTSTWSQMLELIQDYTS